MFERFTQEAREVVVLAQEEARALGHNYIGTEHLLLALVADEAGSAGRVLRSLALTPEQLRADTRVVIGGQPRLDAAALATIGIDLDEVRRRVEESFGPGALKRTPAGCGSAWTPFTPRAKKTLELALREALRLRHRHVGSEHILLGLLREEQGMAVALLRKRDLSPLDVRAAVLDELAGANRADAP